MSVAQDHLISLSKLRLLRLLALTALVVGVGLKCFIDKLAVRDPDMWWHLSVGQWIVQHRAFPHDGIFSQTAASCPLDGLQLGIRSSSLARLRLVQLHRDGTFGTLLTMAVALAIFCMLYAFQDASGPHGRSRSSSTPHSCSTSLRDPCSSP